MSSTRRPFGCESCSKTFTRSENLERHKRSSHGGETRRTFECEHCQAKFSRRDVCKRHASRCGNSNASNHRRNTEGLAPEIPRPPGLDDAAQSLSGFTVNVLYDDSSPSANGAGSNLSQVDISQEAGIESVAPPSGSPLHPTASAYIDVCGTTETASTHITAYFEYFHPALPLIHRPTFDISSAPKPLANIVMAIGSLYAARLFPGNHGPEAALFSETSQELWRQGIGQLQQCVLEDWRQLRKPWMMQACLLHVVYGTFMHETVEQEKTRWMFRSMVDAVRDLGLLKQAVAMSSPQPWLISLVPNWAQHESTQLHDRWQSYVVEETLKLSIFTLQLLDHYISSCCNTRPLLSPLEIGWELPLAASLWEAQDARSWQHELHDQYGTGPAGSLESRLQLPRHSSTSSLSAASQSFMSKTPNAELITAASSSPMTTMCILANFATLVRDFTASYYQLPPSPSDPSAFHILTQNQNRRIHGACRIIATLIEEKMATPMMESERSLWKGCQALSRSVKLSLCRPDDLLVGGIVENTIFAGLLTATQLTLGSYVEFKRTTHALEQHGLGGPNSGDDSLVAIIDELTSALAGISDLTPVGALREVPWITTVSYKILLIVWRTLRQATKNTREKIDKADASGPNHRTFGTSSVIFNTIMETILQHDHQPDTQIKQARLWSTDPATLAIALAESELTIMNFIMRFCDDRSIWSIGPSMADVLREIIATNINVQQQLELG